MALSLTERPQLAHLLRRAGFGARPDEWEEYSALGIKATTQRLLHPETVPDNLEVLLQTIGENFIDFDTLDGVRNWWIFRMAQSRRPLEEKMTLFWHNHFATANYKVNNPRFMARQIDTFREHALGNFRSLLLAMIRDPAMLVWLDGGQNRLNASNENFAREVLELFTMGPGSGYTEKDIQEAARSFTGWIYNNGGFTYSSFAHDDHYKTFMGQSGNFHGDDIVNIIVRQPAVGKFLAGKLWKFFVSETPPPAEIERIGKIYLTSNYDIRAMVEAILTSPSFYAEGSRYARVKSPVEFVVNVIRTLDVPLLAIKNLPGNIEAMGQDLLNPPNVAGWPGGAAWINTRTLLARVNFSSQVTNEMNRRGQLAARVQEKLIAPGAELETAEQVVGAVWDALMPGRVLSGRARVALLGYVGEGKVDLGVKLPGLVSLVMGMPEYQLA